MSAQEVTYKLNVDPTVAAAELRRFAAASKSVTAEITADAKREAAAAAALQRQRSAALITIWKADTHAKSSEERQRTLQEAREERARMQAALSLQKQRSAALVAAWRAEQRDRLRIQQEAERTLVASARTSRGGGAFLAGAAGGVTALIGLSAVSEIRNAASAWIDYSAKLETTKIAFTTMLGSAQAATDHLKELQAFALKTPFQFGELIDASQRMQALGFSASQVIPVLTDVGNAVAAAGGGSERLDRVVLALSQMQSKGKVATQELNQLAESGIGGFKILEQQMGKSRAELIKMVEAGEISSKVFLDAFQKFSQQNFGGLMEAQSKTFTGAMSNIKDALLQTSATAFEPLFQRLTETAQHYSEASKKSDEFKGKLESIGKFATTVWDGAVKAIQVLKDVYSLALTSLFVQFEVMAGFLEYFIRQLKALFLLGVAHSQLVAGNIAGAYKTLNLAIRENQNASEALKRGLLAEGKIVEEITRIYNNAAAAARRLRDERAGVTVGADPGGDVFKRQVGAEVGVGAGILRKATTPETPFEKTAKGSDPAVAARRIAEIQLRATLEGIKAEEEALRRSFKIREILVDEFEATLELKESLRHTAITGALNKERNAALALRDVNAKSVALAEIEARRTEEKLRHEEAVRKLHEEILELQRPRVALAENAARAAERERIALGAIVADLGGGSVVFRGEAERARRVTSDATRPRIATIEGLEKHTKELSDWQLLVKSVEDQMGSFSGFISGGFRNAMLDMRDALAQGVVAWALYGESLGKALRKALAASLAHISADAAIQALYHVAYAIGKLAFGDGAGAARHFVAAAKFGAVAVAAGVGARLVAGNAFSGATGGGGGGTSGGGAAVGAANAPAKTVPVDVNRNINQPLRAEITLKLANGLNQVIEGSVVENWTTNGRIRTVIQSDGQG